MEPKHEFVANRKSSIGVTCLVISLALIAFLCGVSGCLLTVFFYQADIGSVFELNNTTRTIDSVFNVLFYIVPLITAVFVVTLLLTSMGLWFFNGQYQEDA